jgi:hypothetical protein
MVYLQKLNQRYSKDGLFVFAISMHPSAETARKVTREMGITYPVLNGNGSDLGKRYAYG